MKKETIELVKKMIEDGNLSQEIAEKYCPELKESEDERIRKEMIEIIKKEGHDFPSSVIAEKSNSWIAWLEKQGADISLFSNEQQKYMEKYISLDKVTLIKLLAERDRNVEETTKSFEKQNKNNIGISEATKQKLEDNLNKTLEKETPESLNEFLDEQNSAWTEEDKNVWLDIKSLIDSLLSDGGNFDYTTHELQKMWDWLDTIWEKDRVLPQPNQEWSEEDDRMLEELLNYCDTSIQYNGIESQQAIKWKKRKEWLKSLKDRVQPQPQWSEEDIMRIDNLIAIIENRGYPDYVEYLEKLKDRVQPQPKQEWSEEDEKKRLTINKAIWEYTGEDGVTQGEAATLIHWLKSLRPQSQWKPSDEQMDALWNVYRGGKEQAELATLYNDLKKLKEK